MAKTYSPAEEAQYEIERRKHNRATGEYTPARNDEYRRKTGKELAELAGTHKDKKVKKEKVAVHASTKAKTKKLVDALTKETKKTGPSANTILFNALKAQGGVKHAKSMFGKIMRGEVTVAEALK